MDFELTAQLSGTCWICASANAMMTAYQLDHDDKIELDQLDLLNILYNDNKEEGIFLTEGTDKEKYGGLYIGIPDPASKKGTYDGYFTMNCPAPTDGDFDHSIVVLGWDDSFPKDYFHEKATQDGAWITFNSNYPLGFFYISYDTPFDQVYDTPLFLSVTDEYSVVLSHDCGPYFTEPIKTGDTTTLQVSPANPSFRLAMRGSTLAMKPPGSSLDSRPITPASGLCTKTNPAPKPISTALE